MTEPASIMAVLAAIALLTMLIGWWRAENRADRIEADRDTAIKQRDAATAAANQHWRALRRAREELGRLRRGISDEALIRTAETAVLSEEEFRQFRADFKRSVADVPTAVLPATPVPYRWKGGR